MTLKNTEFKNTNTICLIDVHDGNRELGFKHVDVGNYFIDANGKKCLITSRDIAEKYNSYINVPIYVYKRSQA
jgi:hypothetical protein